MNNIQWWTKYAIALSIWAFDNLKNRTDAFGRYRPITKRKSKDDKFYITRRPLILSFLELHFRGDDVGNLISLHTTSKNNQSRWIVLDLDSPKNPTPSDKEKTLNFAINRHDKLIKMGFSPLLEDSDGDGSYRIWIWFKKPVSTEKLFKFCQSLIADYRDFELAIPPEIFPKQPVLKPGQIGNCVRLFGRHHTRDHFSKIWNPDNKTWLENEQAIQRLLATTGDDPALIPAPAEVPAPPKSGAQAPAPKPPVSNTGSSKVQSTEFDRARRYVAKIPPASEGERNTELNKKSFLVATRFKLSKDEHQQVLLAYSAAFSPPLSESEAVKTINSAYSGADRQGLVGSQAPAPRRKTARLLTTNSLKPGATDTVENIITFLNQKCEFSHRTTSNRLFSKTQNFAYLPSELHSLPGIIDLIASSPEALESCCETHEDRLRLATKFCKVAGLRILAKLPDEGPSEDPEIIGGIRDSIIQFLILPRVFYSGDGIVVNASYASWLSSLAPETGWSPCFSHPIYGRIDETGALKFAVQSEYLLDRCPRISKHFMNAATAGKWLLRYGYLIKASNGGGSHLIRTGGRVTRVWRLSQEIIDAACGVIISENTDVTAEDA